MPIIDEFCLFSNIICIVFGECVLDKVIKTIKLLKCMKFIAKIAIRKQPETTNLEHQIV